MWTVASGALSTPKASVGRLGIGEPRAGPSVLTQERVFSSQ